MDRFFLASLELLNDDKTVRIIFFDQDENGVRSVRDIWEGVPEEILEILSRYDVTPDITLMPSETRIATFHHPLPGEIRAWSRVQTYDTWTVSLQMVNQDIRSTEEALKELYAERDKLLADGPGSEVKPPPLTPMDALSGCIHEDPFTKDGWTYVLDGPMMTPTEYLAPTATHKDHENLCWYCTGEPGDGITDETTWIGMEA